LPGSTIPVACPGGLGVRAPALVIGQTKRGDP
jgi:hypothetical protein